MFHQRMLCVTICLLCLAACTSAPQVTLIPTFTPRPTATATLFAPTATPTVAPTAIPTPVPTVSLGFLVNPAATPVETPLATLTPAATAEISTLPSYQALPGNTIPDPFGVNIHFITPEAQEVNLLAAGGFRFVRMDLFWHLIEREIKGRYDFSGYDKLVAAMAARGIRIVFILDYGNDLYGGGNAHHFDEGRAAFARFAAAAVKHYRDKDIIWEIWNEPNLEKFWHGPPDPLYYNKVASEVITAIRRVDPTALIVGPATAGFPWEYLEALAAAGLFNKLDAVTVHPYRALAPESAWEDYARLRGILDRVSPDRKISIIAGEWGYSTVAGGPSEEEQAQYVARQWLAHLVYDVDLSIWYDWRNDGDDPHEIEFNFGLVRQDLTPKPAYLASKVLVETLRGYHFQRRIPLADPGDYVLLFGNDGHAALALWTNGKPHKIMLPVFCDVVEVVEMNGKSSRVPGGEWGLELELTPAPRYVRLCQSETITRLALWRPVDSIHILSPDGAGRVLVEVQNPFSEPLQGDLQVAAQGETLGVIQAQVRPGATEKVSIPVQIEAAPGQVIPATVVFITPDGLPLQSAAIWLHVVREK